LVVFPPKPAPDTTHPGTPPGRARGDQFNQGIGVLARESILEPRNPNGEFLVNQCRDCHPGGQDDDTTRQGGRNHNRRKDAIPTTSSTALSCPSSTPMHRGHPETEPLCGKKSGRPTSQQTMSSLEVTSTTWKRRRPEVRLGKGGCTEERQPPSTT